MTKWEYCEAAVPIGQQQAVLKRAGAEGWELAAVVPASVSTSPLMPNAQPGLILFLKRPLADSEVRGELAGKLMPSGV